MFMIPESKRTPIIMPSAEVYEDAVKKVARDIDDEGGTARFLGRIHESHRNSWNYHMYLTTVALYAIALELKQKNEKGGETEKLQDPDHKTANIFLSGMMTGNAINQALYPPFFPFKPFNAVSFNDQFLGESAGEFKEKGSECTAQGLRVGVGVLSQVALSRVNQTTLDIIEGFSEGLTPDPDLRDVYGRAVGFELYNGYQYHLQRQTAHDLLYDEPPLVY